MNIEITQIGCLVLSYLSGSIPFGLILTNIFGNLDIRKIGSGNIGATNVLRSGNKYLALATLLFDVMKGYVPIVLTINFFPELVYTASIMVFLGHVFPIWLKFKGGKGVATYLGVLFALSLKLSFLFIFTWIVVLLIFKYSSVSSIFATLTVFVVSLIESNVVELIKPDALSVPNLNLILFAFFVLIVFTHKKNISNLKNKTEQKIKI